MMKMWAGWVVVFLRAGVPRGACGVNCNSDLHGHIVVVVAAAAPGVGVLVVVVVVGGGVVVVVVVVPTSRISDGGVFEHLST